MQRLTQSWQAEHEDWGRRDLTGTSYVYWWADGVHFDVRLEEDRLCCLVIVGVRPDGTKELEDRRCARIARRLRPQAAAPIETAEKPSTRPQASDHLRHVLNPDLPVLQSADCASGSAAPASPVKHSYTNRADADAHMVLPTTNGGRTRLKPGPPSEGFPQPRNGSMMHHKRHQPARASTFMSRLDGAESPLASIVGSA